MPWSPLAPGRSRASVRLLSPLIGIQRSCTLRKKTIPVGPQYSSEFGNTSGSMNGLQVLAGAERAELAVCVAETERGLAFVDAGAEQLELEGGLRVRRASVGVEDLNAEAALPHAGEGAVVLRRTRSATDGSLVTRMVSYQFGLICLKSWPMSSIANP